MKCQTDEYSVKKGAIYLVSIDNRNYRICVTVLFLMTTIQCFVYLSREIFFPRHVYTCRRWEKKYYDIVLCDVCDGLIGNTSECTHMKLPFET